MRNKNLFEICHGCARELYRFEHHWKVRILNQDKVALFHNGCYERYPARKIAWAEEKKPR